MVKFELQNEFKDINKFQSLLGYKINMSTSLSISIKSSERNDQLNVFTNLKEFIFQLTKK